MAVTWVRMRHNKHSGETDVPAKAVERYKRRGWRPVNDTIKKNPRRGQAAEQQPEQREENAT